MGGAVLKDGDFSESRLMDLVRLDPEIWFRHFAVIHDIEGREVRGPVPNKLQLRMFDAYRLCRQARKPCRMIILKPRRKGASTCAQSLIYHHLQANHGLRAKMMGDIDSTSDEIFGMFQLYARNDRFDWSGRGQVYAPNGDLTDDQILWNGSIYRKTTAGSKNAGRGGGIQAGNMTECAHWVRDPTLGFLPSAQAALTSDVGLLIADSTPNGPAGWFYETCMRAMARRGDLSSWQFIFAAWWEFEDSMMAFSCEEEREEFEAELREDEREELRRFGKNGEITLEHLKWRRAIIEEFCNGDVDRFRQEYPSDPTQCFLKSGRPRFNIEVLERMATLAEEIHPQRGTIELHEDSMKATFHPDPEGDVEIYEEPVYGLRYLVAADTMTGEDQIDDEERSEPDWHSIGVWRAEYFDEVLRIHYLPRLVALWTGQQDIDIATEVAAGLSLFFCPDGGCLVIPEVNNCGLAMVKDLDAMGIPLFDRRRRTKQGMSEKSVGWKTTPITRKTIIDKLARLIRDQAVDIPSSEVIDQLKTFVIDKRGIPSAMPGKHDDHVMQCAIALSNIDLATTREIPRKPRLSRRALMRNPYLESPDGFAKVRYLR